MARLRSLAIVESSLAGVRSLPSEGDLKRVAKRIAAGEGWKAVFPGVSTLSLSTEGTGLSVSLRITKKEGEAIHLVPEGTPGGTVVAIKRVNELDYYSLSLTQLAEKLDLSRMRALALVRHSRIQESDDYFKEITVGKAHFKRYSAKALEKLKADLETVDMGEVWARLGGSTPLPPPATRQAVRHRRPACRPPALRELRLDRELARQRGALLAGLGGRAGRSLVAIPGRRSARGHAP